MSSFQPLYFFLSLVISILLAGNHHALAFGPVKVTRTHFLAASSGLPVQLFLSADDKPPEDPTVEDDDGWGDESSSSSSSVALKEELESLRSSSSSSSQPAQEAEPERDLFIPIFTLVSVIGFGGLYAYETLRLYLNGELYLPGN